MLLSDLYYKKDLYSGADFYDKYKFLSNVNFPSNEQIANFQLRQIKQQFPVDGKLQKIVKRMNLDMMVPVVDRDNEVVDKVIQSIENALGLWYQSNDPHSAAKIHSTISSDVLQGLQVNLSQYEGLLQNLQDVYSKLNTSEYNNSDFIRTRLEQINDAIQRLQADISSYKAGTFQPISNPGNNEEGYLAKAVNLGHDLKGKYLEIAATNWFEDKLPSNIRVVDVGNITGLSYDIFGGAKSKGKQLRTDIMGFDKGLAQQIYIEYELNGQKVTTTIWEMLERIKQNSGNDSISLNSTDYSQIQKALVFGAQAKSGKGQAIFNRTSTTLRGVIQENLPMGYAKALNALTEIASNSESRIINKSKNYDALFNYLLGKQMGYIIGKENNLVVTRKGVQTIYEYMKDQWEQSQRVVRAVDKRVNIKNPDTKLTIGFAKTEE